MTNENTPRQNIADAMASLGLSVESTFVPFSQSRHAKPAKGEKKPWRSINWKVRLMRQGRLIVETDYSAGLAHVPAYNVRENHAGIGKSGGLNLIGDAAVTYEIEHGRTSTVHGRGAPILPDAESVIHSLVMDSDVLEYGSFEDWAGSIGYDPDSRSAESTYRTCLEIALKLRNALGDDGLSRLREACQDF